MKSRLKRRLRRIVRESRRLNEDEIDTELDRLHKNIKDDIDHIKDLKRDIESDRDEEERAEDKKERKDESLRRHIKKIVRKNVFQETRGFETSVDIDAENEEFELAELVPVWSERIQSWIHTQWSPDSDFSSVRAERPAIIAALRKVANDMGEWLD